MKRTVSIARILTGILFIFSGLVKAIDPRGLAYKMEEFFEVWGRTASLKGIMQSLSDQALSFSIIMITLEVVVGVALLIGWQRKLTAWILLLLMLFFTFLTSFVLFTGKIKACGCFGDCVPLTPIQTFTKDIILLILALLLLIKNRYISPIAKPFFSFLYILAATLLTLLLQWYVMRHLPLVDCLPYKKGNNILELRKMPAGAIADKYDYVFVYEKAGESKDFPVSALPDSTWKFVERKQTLVQKGVNNIPLINDFSLTDTDGNDVTESILNHPDEYYLLFLRSIDDNSGKWVDEFKALRNQAAGLAKKLYVVTPQRDAIQNFLTRNNIVVDGILTSDATAIKTAARVNPTLYKMKGPVVQKKLGWADLKVVGNR